MVANDNRRTIIGFDASKLTPKQLKDFLADEKNARDKIRAKAQKKSKKVS